MAVKTIMKIEAKVGVDAGMILVCDAEYYGPYNGLVDTWLASVTNVEPGVYEAKWHLPKTHNGPQKGAGKLSLPSGKLVISDPCYCIRGDEDWVRFLRAKRNDNGNGIILLDRMGGDGVYDVILSLTKKTECSISHKEETP